LFLIYFFVGCLISLIVVDVSLYTYVYKSLFITPLIINKTINYNNEIEFYNNTHLIHKFESINKTYYNYPVIATYHYVECGNKNNEKIVFYHGLFESWILWRDVMVKFCDKYNVYAVDVEGHGQSNFTDIEKYIFKNDSRKFISDMQKQLLYQLNITKFNIVVTDVSFWFYLHLFDNDDIKIIRYAKFQSTVGQEDGKRIPQGKIIRKIPDVVKYITNKYPFIVTDILFNKTNITNNLFYRNKRIDKDIDYATYHSLILNQLTNNLGVMWKILYSLGIDLPNQLDLQRKIFFNLKIPVYILQGEHDPGQPLDLFNGNINSTIYIENGIKKINVTHSNVKIGLSAIEFFPNSIWKKFKIAKNTGHFLHIESPEICIDVLNELLNVPIDNLTIV
jgi:pimeloyl-ACP methyl ester carboxylesterase